MKGGADIIAINTARTISRGGMRAADAEPEVADLAALGALLERSLDMAMMLNLRLTALNIGSALDALEECRARKGRSLAGRGLD